MGEIVQFPVMTKSAHEELQAGMVEIVTNAGLSPELGEEAFQRMKPLMDILTNTHLSIPVSGTESLNEVITLFVKQLSDILIRERLYRELNFT